MEKSDYTTAGRHMVQEEGTTEICWGDLMRGVCGVISPTTEGVS